MEPAGQPCCSGPQARFCHAAFRLALALAWQGRPWAEATKCAQNEGGCTSNVQQFRDDLGFLPAGGRHPLQTKQASVWNHGTHRGTVHAAVLVGAERKWEGRARWPALARRQLLRLAAGDVLVCRALPGPGPSAAAGVHEWSKMEQPERMASVLPADSTSGPLPQSTVDLVRRGQGAPRGAARAQERTARRRMSVRVMMEMGLFSGSTTYTRWIRRLRGGGGRKEGRSWGDGLGADALCPCPFYEGGPPATEGDHLHARHTSTQPRS